jgi:hypothetical protein
MQLQTGLYCYHHTAVMQKCSQCNSCYYTLQHLRRQSILHIKHWHSKHLRSHNLNNYIISNIVRMSLLLLMSHTAECNNLFAIHQKLIPVVCQFKTGCYCFDLMMILVYMFKISCNLYKMLHELNLSFCKRNTIYKPAFTVLVCHLKKYSQIKFPTHCLSKVNGMSVLYKNLLSDL